ncbi:hypothetical protein [Flavobacterium sp. '19STA2R22 D10 B1']|uniref:hypothetical protein n=1 Tax=Flavobacterium aerium TaxID=3037261 RepID=UPI00278BC07A|nr:hypothetical protein [Flavobacterium sp. '19STA2R22 D10 B1']
MDKKLKQFLTKSIITLAVIHLAYFIYGYLKFEGLKKINIYTEYYRFKFYDDVSISHFFVSGLFLLLFLFFLLRNHSKQKYNLVNVLKIGTVLLLISFLTFTFFISYSFGLNTKLKKELSEKNYNEDKLLLNVLNPFLYKYTSYSSEKLFNIENILYPKPYPVIALKDTIYQDPQNKEYSAIKSNYYSIDTLKVLTVNYEKLNSKKDAIFDALGFDKTALTERIISKKTIKDSTEIIYRGREVSPQYDQDICIFLENQHVFIPIHKVPLAKQKYQNAVTRYKLLYKYKQDSLLHSFDKLVILLKKYDIETQIVAKNLTKDAFHYRDNNQEPLNAIRNTFDRDALTNKLQTLDKLFYKPNYLHPSIQVIFITVVISIWLILFLLYIIWNSKNKKQI